MASGTDGPLFDILVLGQKHPAWDANATFGTRLNINEGGMFFLTCIPQPTRQDIEDYGMLVSYGIYFDRYPLMLWQFANGLFFDSPFDPRFQEQVFAGSMNAFMEKKINALYRALVNENGIILNLSSAGLKWDFIFQVVDYFGRKNIDWSGYNRWLYDLQSFSLDELWAKSERFVHEKATLNS